MKAIAFDKNCILIYTNSNGNYRQPIGTQQEIAVKSIAFYKKSITSDTKSIRNYRKSS